MKTSESDGFDRDDPLWDVLGRARKPAAPDPWFAQKVLRAIDADQQAVQPPAPPWVRWRSWFTSGASTWLPVAAALTLAVGVLHYAVPTRLAVPADDQAEAVTQVTSLTDIENPDQRVDSVLEDLDALVAFDEASPGLDEPMMRH